MIENRFQHVFVPMPDVYVQGGLDVFTELERKKDNNQNAVVIPLSFFDELERSALRGHNGADDVILELNNLRHEPTADERIRRYGGEQPGLARFLLIDDDTPMSIEALARTIDSTFTNTAHRPRVLTTNQATIAKLRARNIRAETPTLLQISKDILDEWMITAEPAFSGLLYDHGKPRVITIPEAESALGRKWQDAPNGLYPNQFIRVMGKQSFQYLRVAVDVVRGARGDIETYDNPRIEPVFPRTQKASKHTANPERNVLRMHVGRLPMTDVVGIEPLDMEQFLALEYALLNPDVETVFLTGGQASGKTVLAYASAVDQILAYDGQWAIERGHQEGVGLYDQIVLFKPNDPMGSTSRNLGFLPGDLYEKVKDILASFADAHRISQLGPDVPFEQMFCHPKYKTNQFPQREKALNTRKFGRDGRGGTLPKDNWAIELVHSGLVRGRSIPNTIFLIDEAQNFSSYELKTLLERTAQDTKAIVLGDVRQLEPHRDGARHRSSLLNAVKHHLGMPHVAVVNLSTNYRGTISKAADKWRVYT